MHRRNLLGAALLLAASPLLSTVAAEPLPSDARIQTGTLDNGVRWMYRQHDNPPGRMALMINIDSGSLNETDVQRGLAHFIEHMAFNGSEHFAPGTLVPYFESIGMEFGADLNAFTSFDQTVYMLFLPDTQEATLDRALTVLSDYAFRVSFVPEEIEKERNVILAEKRSGENVGQRIRDRLWPELYAGSRVAERLPIGLEEIIKGAGREEFVDYYQTWYRPELMTVMAVGDAPAEQVTPLIAKWFGQVRAAKPARPARDAALKPDARERAIVVSDREWASGQIQLSTLRQGRPPTTTVELMRAELIDGIGRWIVGRRFQEKVRNGQAPYRSAGAGVSSFMKEVLQASAGATGEPDDWDKMLSDVIYEVNRAREFGFQEHELSLAKKDFLADAERAVRTEPTVAARGLLMQMNRAVNDREPILSAQQELELMQRLLPAITLEDVNKPFAEMFAPGTFTYVITLPEKEGLALPTREKVLEVARAAQARKPEPLPESSEKADLLAAEPIPGKLGETTADPDLDITSGWLSNGVRVHHRFMDYKKDQVTVTIALAGGKIEETPANAGVSEVSTRLVSQPATSRLSSTEIRDLLTGKNVRVAAGATPDAFVLRVSGSPRDLETGLRLAYALLTEAKLEETAFSTWKQGATQQRAMFRRWPEFAAAEALIDLTTGGDPRLTPMTEEKIAAQSPPAVQAWFDRLRAEAPIEVAVVGEMTLDEVQPLIEKYIGALPPRPRTAAKLDALRTLHRPAGPLEKRVAVDTETNKAMVQFGWAGGKRGDVRESRALELAQHVISSRLVKRVREDLALVYSIRAQNTDGRVFDDSALFFSGAPCDPAKAEEVIAEISKIFADFAENGPTAEELENAKKQVLNNLDEQRKEPSYWLAVLQHLDLHGIRLQDEKDDVDAFKAFTAEQVRDVFHAYFVPTRTFRVIAAPAEHGAAPAETTAPAKAAAPAGS